MVSTQKMMTRVRGGSMREFTTRVRQCGMVDSYQFKNALLEVQFSGIFVKDVILEEAIGG